MAQLAFTRSGIGVPLVLLHGIGLSRQSWNPVIPALAGEFDVIAVDLPGFGDSPPLPRGIEPAPSALAAAVADLLDGLGVTGAHVAGNSLGGWVALELAGIRPVSSVALLSPAGMWRAGTPRYCRVSLNITRWLSRHAGGMLSRVVAFPIGRAIVFGQSHGHPMRLSPAYARAAIRAMASGPGFESTMKATAHRRFTTTRPITAPVTVEFGSRDFVLLPRQSRRVDQLPRGTRVQKLAGCGHVPMYDDPRAVADFIKTSVALTRV